MTHPSAPVTEEVRLVEKDFDVLRRTLNSPPKPNKKLKRLMRANSWPLTNGGVSE